MSDLARYVWHPQLHRELGERLYFIRLSFEPVYPELENILVKRLKEQGVGSYHAYELIGAFDVMLRIWYSGDIRALIRELELPELRRADFMEVSEIHEHWALSEADVDEEPRLTEIPAQLVEELNVEMNRSEGRDLSRYVDQGLIAPIPMRGGVKFFVSVTASTGTSASIKFDEILFSHVNRILDSASGLLDGRSIYAGHGFARLLLMGRFEPENYFEFVNRVILALNDDYLRDMFSARTSTAFGARQMPLLGADLLDLQRLKKVVSGERADALTDEPLVDLEKLLAEGENERVEVKASAFLSFDRFVHQNESDWSQLRPEFIKAVCGLLNRLDRRSGTLIVGAVETERYRDWLSQLPDKPSEIGDFTLTGLEFDHPSGEWDVYQRRLTDALDSAIQPAPTPYMSFALEKQVADDGKVLLRINLRPSGQPFYADSHLWVRQGTQAKELLDRERDHYVEQMKQAIKDA